jgi:hypothetical protein
MLVGKQWCKDSVKCMIWGSHGGDYEDHCLLGCDVIFGWLCYVGYCVLLEVYLILLDVWGIYARVVIVVTDTGDVQRIPVSLPISVTDTEIKIPHDYSESQNGRRASVLVTNTYVSIAYGCLRRTCGVFAQSKNCWGRETAIAR